LPTSAQHDKLAPADAHAGVISCEMRTIFWEDNTLKMIDQRKLPASLEIVPMHTYLDVAAAIQNMTVRGAPAIGAAAAFGLALAAMESRSHSTASLLSDLETAKDTLKASRPTAINLTWALERVMHAARAGEGSVDDLRGLVLAEAQRIADEDVEINKRMGEYGSPLIDDGDTLIHHCNTGSLAVVDWGTALGVIRTAHEQGKRLHVLVDETRPRLQGARLTAGQVNKVIFGADRIASNGDVANKIGTYMLALAAQDNSVPVFSVAPTSTVDLSISNGKLIPIEERDPEEVLGLQYQGERIAPEGAKARNPAFDITPNRLITAIITENGIVKPPFDVNLKIAVNASKT
jgi:methylthioribose-1-phosphate isomerase